MRSFSLASVMRAVLVVTLGALSLQLGACAGTEDRDEVWLVGLDGADWDLLDPMIAAGRLPHLAQLRREGAFGRLRSDKPMLSPILWTSMATGKSADDHGITWFMTDSPTGEKIPISSWNRKVRALWTIASEAQLEVGVVGWWATWPVEPVRGFLVSDYVGWHSFGVSGRPVEGGAKVWPSSWEPWVLETMPDPQALSAETLQRMVHLPAARLGFDAARGPFGGPIPHLRQAIATARGYTDVALEALSRRRPDFFALYYEGTDAVEHLFGQYMPPRSPWIDAVDYEAFRDAVEGYWEYQDELLGEILARRGPRTTVMVVSDHGFRQGEERLRETEFSVDRADASHINDGIVVISGPAIPQGLELRGASIYDITPTALYLLGLPVAQDMRGQVLRQAFSEGYLRAHPQSVVDTYETGPWKRGEMVAADAESGRQLEEMLRSLGYISGGDGTSEGAGESSGEAMAAENAINLAVVYQQQGEYDRAAEVLRRQLEVRPDHFEAKLNLAQVHALAGDFDAALAVYAQLREEAPTNLEVIEDYGLALGHAGRDAEAAEVFGQGIELREDWAMGWAGLGFAQYRSDHRAVGIASLDRALELDDRLATAHFYRGMVAEEEGDSSRARREFERTLSLDPLHRESVLRLAGMDQTRGDLRGARRRLGAFLDRAGPVTEVRAEQAGIDLKLGKAGRALVVLRELATLRPDDPAILGNLGVAQAMTGDREGARRSFEELVLLRPNSPDGYAMLANLNAEMGHSNAALRQFKRARELAPEDVSLLLSLGSLYHRLGRFEDAIPLYEQVLELQPDHAIALYQLAMAVGSAGDEDRARQLLRRARDLDPNLVRPGPE